MEKAASLSEWKPLFFNVQLLWTTHVEKAVSIRMDVQLLYITHIERGSISNKMEAFLFSAYSFYIQSSEEG